MTIDGKGLIVPIISARGGGKCDHRWEWGPAGRLLSPGPGHRDPGLQAWTYLFFKEYLSLIFFLLIKDVKIFLGTENFLLTNYANC